MELLIVGVVVLVVLICKGTRESSYQNYLPPEGYVIDHQAQTIDMTCHGVSKAEVQRRTVAGYYNVPCDEFGCTIR